MEKGKIHAVVAPRKKEVKIMIGKEVLKTYRFKQDVPFKMVEKEFEGYDSKAWSVSEREFTYKKTVKEYDKDVMDEIANKTLTIYLADNIRTQSK